MAAVRKTPTPTNGGSGVGTTYTVAVDTEIEALWTVSAGFLTSVAGTNVITAASDSALVGPIAAYARPMAFWLVPANSNTSSVTINIDSVGAVNLVDKDGNALVSSAIIAGRLHLIVFDGTNFRVFSSPTPAVNPTPAPDIILQEQAPQNTGGGTFNSAAWEIRQLNTMVRNVVAGASLSTYVLTLPPGTYSAEWSAPTYSCGGNQTRLYNVTDSTVIAMGGSAFGVGSGSTSESAGIAVFTITSTKAIRLEHFCLITQATNGFGYPANAGTELYSWLNLYKIA